MARQSNIKREQSFIWLPREKATTYDVKIDGVSVFDDMISSSFERAVSPEIGKFFIKLINADGKYSGVYKGSETVNLYCDLGTASKIVTISGENMDTTLIEGTDRL